MSRHGPERSKKPAYEHPDRKTQIEDAAAAAGLRSASAWLRRAHAYALLNMPQDWTDPQPPPKGRKVSLWAREHPDRQKQIDDAALASGESVSLWMSRSHAFALHNMPKDWTDPNPPSDQGDG